MQEEFLKKKELKLIHAWQKSNLSHYKLFIIGEGEVKKTRKKIHDNNIEFLILAK